GALAGEEFSPINLISFSVEAAEIFRSSYLSNQNALHVLQISTSTGAVKCASRVIAIISAEQFVQFIRPHIAPKPEIGIRTRTSQPFAHFCDIICSKTSSA